MNKPTRMIDAAEPRALRDALQEAREGLGGSEDVARLRLKLGALPEVTASASVSTGAAMHTAGWVRVVLHACVITAAGGALVVGWRALQASEAPVREASRPLVLEAQQGAKAAPAFAAEAPAPAVSEAVAPAPKLEPRARRAAPRDKPAAPTEAVATPSGVSELALLRDAQDKLERSPQRALALLDQHASEHPSGNFALERESLAIDALRKLGRERAARERAQRFVESFPNAPQARSMRVWLDENANPDHKDGPLALPMR
jgi:hypothetical protein